MRSQRAATTAALEHGELLRRERELAAKEEELRGWKDARVEQGLAQVKVRIRTGRSSCVSEAAGVVVYLMKGVEVRTRQGGSRCVVDRKRPPRPWKYLNLGEEVGHSLQLHPKCFAQSVCTLCPVEQVDMVC